LVLLSDAAAFLALAASPIMAAIRDTKSPKEFSSPGQYAVCTGSSLMKATRSAQPSMRFRSRVFNLLRLLRSDDVLPALK
jgi:hypothetical protein